MGFSLGIFLFSAAAMYTVWRAFEDLDALARDVVSLFSFIFAFSGGTFLFWKAIERMTVTEVSR